MNNVPQNAGSAHVMMLFAGNALQRFQLQRLQRQINNAESNQPIDTIEASLIYAVRLATDNPLSSAREQALAQLLEASLDQPELGEHVLISMPRAGTISPWSSKATDIAKSCGFDEIERVEVCTAYHLSGSISEAAKLSLYDPMMQQLSNSLDDIPSLFEAQQQRPLKRYDGELGQALNTANEELALGLSTTELDYLVEGYSALERVPTDAELMMFAQANSEHLSLIHI